MIAQSIINPCGVCEEIELYYRIKGTSRILDEGIQLQANAELRTDTYMNIFDSAIWEKYTEASQCVLCMNALGAGTIELIEKSGNKERLLATYEVSTDKEINISIPFDLADENNMYYIRVKAKKSLYIKNACYKLNECTIKRDIHISIVICTYKRKENLYHTLETFKNSKFFQKNSVYHGKLSVRVVDNASELPMQDEKLLKIYHNKNTGGSGGFTRGIVETRKDVKQYKITHTVLMDDDVEIIPETFYRLYSFLKLIKDEYKNEMIAGRMFRLEQKYIQYTAAEIWNKGAIKHVGLNLDMRRQENIIDLNNNDGAEYSGWWLACFSIEFIMNNTPLPFFLHCDDVEYGLRHGGNPIIMNGFQVWHESFENRMTPVIAYYDTRNPLIINTIYDLATNYDEILISWKEKLAEQHINKNFLTERMIIKGMRDYCKGPKYWLTLNSNKKNNKLKRKKHVNRYINSFLWRITEIKTKKMFEVMRHQYKEDVKCNR